MVSPDPLFTFRPHCGEVTSLKYLKLSEGGSGIASGSSTGIIHLWSLISKRSVWREDVASSVMFLGTCFLNGDARLISQTRNNCVDVWDYFVQKKMSSFIIRDPGFCKISVFSNSCMRTCFAAPSQESCKINVYDVPSGKIEECYTTKESKSRGMCMCINSLCDASSGVCYILGGFEDGTLILWDERNTSTHLHTCQLFSDPVLCMAVDDAIRGAAGSVGNSVQCFSASLEKDNCKKSFTIGIKNPGISDIAVRGDQKLFATGGWDGRIRVFPWMKRGDPLAIINYHTHAINCIEFSGNESLQKDKNLLLCGSKDEVISVWNLF